MKYKLKTSKEITENFLAELLKDRQIPIPEDGTQFYYPTEENELPAVYLDNMEEGYQMIKRHVLNGSRVLLIVDPDVDGFTSASLFYLFMQDYTGNGMQIDYHIPEGKEHGLQTLMGLFEGPRKYDLVVVPDGGSNDYEEHKTLSEMGYDVLILDHHQAPHYSDHAVLINNQLSDSYENKELSGVGVVWKFCEYFEYRYWEDMKSNEQFEPKANYYIDLVALGISNCANTSFLFC